MTKSETSETDELKKKKIEFCEKEAKNVIAASL